jgi:hypothetical protein
MKAPIPSKVLSKRFLTLGEKRQGTILRRTENLARAFDKHAQDLFVELREIRNTEIKNRADLNHTYAKLAKLIDKKKKLQLQLQRSVKNSSKNFIGFKPLQGGRSLTENHIELIMHKSYQRISSLENFITSFQGELYMHQGEVIQKEKGSENGQSNSTQRRWI